MTTAGRAQHLPTDRPLSRRQEERTGDGRGPWPALLVLCLANFLILLDTSIVNTAAPDMMRSLGTGIDSVLWVLNGYLLALASLLVVAGRLGDLFGPRTVFVAGMVVFTVASVACGAAQSPGQLVAARVVQGVGAAALLPQALVIITAVFPPARRGAAFGVFTAVAGIAAVSGPTLGGLVVTHLGWQWIFYLNVPFALAGTVLAGLLVPDLRTARPTRFDVGGTLLATTGLVCLVFALIEGERHHWGRLWGPITVLHVLTTATVLLGAFVWWERRHPEPMMPPALFRDRNFAVATMITMITSSALYGFLLVFVIETQTLLGMSPLRSGLTALPWTVVLCLVAPVAGRLTDRIGGRRLLVGGMTAYALGVLGMAAPTAPTSHAGSFALPLVLVGLGMGASIVPTTTEAMRGIPAPAAGAASAVLNTARQVGAALGAAVCGAVLQNRLVHSLHDVALLRASALPPGVRDRFAAGFADTSRDGLHLGTGQNGGMPLPDDLPPGLTDRYQALVVDTFHQAFLPAARATLAVVGATLLLGAVLAGLLRGSARPVDPSRDPAVGRDRQHHLP